MNTWLLIQALSTPFSLLVTLGTLWGLGGSVWRSADRKRLILDGGLLILSMALVGARLDHVLLHRAYFLVHPSEIPQVWLGGLGWAGALGGGLLGVGMISLGKNVSLGFLLDSYVPLLGALSLSMGIASLFGGMGYGPKTTAWWGLPIPDEFGVFQTRWPIHLWGGLVCGMILFALSYPLADRPWFTKPGRRGSLGLVVFGLVMTGISALRVDPGPFLSGLRRESWAGLFFMVLALLSLIFYVRCPYED